MSRGVLHRQGSREARLSHSRSTCHRATSKQPLLRLTSKGPPIPKKRLGLPRRLPRRPVTTQKEGGRDHPEDDPGADSGGAVAGSAGEPESDRATAGRHHRGRRQAHHLDQLRQARRIRRVGPDRGGRWEIFGGPNGYGRRERDPHAEARDRLLPGRPRLHLPAQSR